MAGSSAARSLSFSFSYGATLISSGFLVYRSIKKAPCPHWSSLKCMELSGDADEREERSRIFWYNSDTANPRKTDTVDYNNMETMEINMIISQKYKEGKYNVVVTVTCK